MQKKRILAALLSAAMVITSAAVPVLAEDGTPLKDYDIICAFKDMSSDGETVHNEFTEPVSLYSVGRVDRQYEMPFYSFEEIFEFLAAGEKVTNYSGKIVIDKSKPVTVVISGVVEEFDQTISKKIVFTNSSKSEPVTAAAYDDAIVIDNTSEEGITIEHHSSGGATFSPAIQRHNKFRFAGGIEIQNGAKLSVTPYDTGYFNDRLELVFGQSITVAEGGVFDAKGSPMTSKSGLVPPGSEYDFDQSLTLTFNDSSKLDIQAGAKASLEAAKVTGETSPLIDNSGELELKKNRPEYNAHGSGTSDVQLASEDGPAVKCNDGSEITITGGSTVTNESTDPSADAVDLAPGTTVKTEAGTTVVSEEPAEEGKGSYIDNNGNLVLPNGGTKYAPDEGPDSGEGTPIPENSLETPDGTIYSGGADGEPPVVPQAGTLSIYFVRQKDSNRKYDIVIRSSDGTNINKFNNAQLTFDNTGTAKYMITPAEKFDLIDKGEGLYEFHYQSKADDVITDGDGRIDTQAEIIIGTVEFLGYGTVVFGIKTADTALDNQAHATDSDNIVHDYTVADGTLNVNGANMVKDENTYFGKITDTEIEPELVPVQINLMFPNRVETDKDVNHTAMTVEVNGGVREGDTALEPYSAEIKLGTPDGELPEGVEVKNDAKFKYDSTLGADPQVEEVDTEADANANGYTITLNVPVPENTGSRYTFKFIGEGYRTYTVDAVITSETEGEAVKTHMINVWNNVMDNNITVTESDGFDDVKLPVTFLAGDIVEDNTINLYDLSAVVAYFGKDGDTSGYVQYDLNRDGQIDSKDIAMVLVSWGK